MAQLYEINQKYIEALNNAFVVDEETGEVVVQEDALNKLEGEFEEKVDNIACYIKNLENLQNGIKNEVDNLKKRSNVIDKKVEYLEELILSSMDIRNTKKIETPKNRISYRTSTTVVIDEPEKIDKRFIKTKTTESVDLNEIKKALKLNILVEGASLKTTRHLQIK